MICYTEIFQMSKLLVYVCVQCVQCFKFFKILLWIKFYDIQGVPLATESGISLIILPLAGGLLLSVVTIRRTTDTHYRHIPLHFSHKERTPVQISL